MAAERFVLLGLAQVRSSWFGEVSRWATSTALPVEFIKNMSIEEVRVRLRSGRGYSALLIDDAIPGFDRDLIDLALGAGCAVVVVDSGRSTRDWIALGASAVLAPSFARGDLLQVLNQVATPVERASEASASLAPGGGPSGYRGRVVAMTGSGGTGCSTIAMALAQGLAADPRQADLVCLADLRLHADHAMLHDALDVVPGILELVDAHRSGTPTIDAVRSLTWELRPRGYHLLLGLRRHRDWTAVRPRAFEAALDGLRRGFRVVVADIDADLEGERATGSVDVEERNVMARTVASAADVLVVVGRPGMQGVHGMLRVTRHLLDHGVTAGRILPVVNRSPRSPRARAELTRAFGELLSAGPGAEGVPSPVHVSERRHLDEVLRDGVRLPDAWLAPVCGPVLALLERFEAADAPGTIDQPVRVAPGSLGAWTDQGTDDTLDPGEG
jgi:MinD-like ATPase involved in chromosome partitioning or flagellar assembly